MNENSSIDISLFPCSACSPTEDVLHILLNSTKDYLTLKCDQCNHVHKQNIVPPKLTNCNIVVSQHEESLSTVISLPSDSIFEVGGEFIVDTEESLFAVSITSIESKSSSKRISKSPAKDIKTIWSRAIDNVNVNVTIHALGADRHKSKSLKLGVPGDYIFSVGETKKLEGISFLIEGIYLRKISSNDSLPKLNSNGESAPAKNIKRIYASESQYPHELSRKEHQWHGRSRYNSFRK
jgi:uncharacterized Zn finger protein